MMRWPILAACVVAILVAVACMAVLSCRTSVPPDSSSNHGEGGLVVQPATSPGEAPDEEDRGGPTPIPAGAPSDEYEKVLSEFGLSEPLTDEQLLALMRRLVDADDATLKRVLVALLEGFSGSYSLEKGKGLLQGRKWDLPETFGARLLALIRPLLNQKVGFDPLSDDTKFLLMSIEVLARMQYGPALEELMRSGGIRALEGKVHWIWSRFGKAAVRPLLDRARSSTGRDREQALNALAGLRDPAAAQDLRPILDSEDAAERAAATRALREMGAVMDLTKFQQVLDNPRSKFSERREAILALAKSGGPVELEDLLHRVQAIVASRPPRRFEDVSSVAEALRALIERGDPATLAWTLDFIQRKDLDAEANEKMRNPVIRALGVHRVRAAEATLISILNDEGLDLSARQYAADALARIDRSREPYYIERAEELQRREQERR